MPFGAFPANFLSGRRRMFTICELWAQSLVALMSALGRTTGAQLSTFRPAIQVEAILDESISHSGYFLVSPFALL